ncbi:MAG: hypothetical protein RIR01_675 [Bacteroidota bacterium]|jgi:hypothetical protein
MSGWIKIHRSITNHWLYSEKRVYSKLEAWYDMLIAVNYSDSKTLIKGKLYEVKRGQSIMSLDSWAKRWNWDKSKVRRFLNTLQNDNMIELKSDTITTRLTICNYESYQGERNADETPVKRKRNSDETQTTPIEERKENKEILFNDFWKIYDKQIDRKKCLEKFLKLKDQEIKLIFENLPNYILNTPDKQFRKNPSTWINNKCWNDTEYSKPKTITYTPNIIHE